MVDYLDPNKIEDSAAASLRKDLGQKAQLEGQLVELQQELGRLAENAPPSGRARILLDMARLYGEAKRPESLSKYLPDASAKSLDSAARMRISVPIRISLPAMPKPCFTILVPSNDPGLTAMIAGPLPLSESAKLRDHIVSASLL